MNTVRNVALAENVALLEHEEWVAKRPIPGRETIAEVLAILGRPKALMPEEGDKLPEGYVDAGYMPDAGR